MLFAIFPQQNRGFFRHFPRRQNPAVRLQLNLRSSAVKIFPAFMLFAPFAHFVVKYFVSVRPSKKIPTSQWTAHGGWDTLFAQRDGRCAVADMTWHSN
jgi:hypothetical protein